MAEDDVQENEGAEGAEGEGEDAGGSKKKLILILVPVLLVIIGVAAFLMMGGSDKKDGDQADAANAEDQIPVDENGVPIPENAALSFYDLPEILVNLSSPGKKKHFLKIAISLEVENEKFIPELQKFEPRIVDKFQIYLRDLTVDDLQGSEAVYRLREELLNRVNTTVKPIKINQVLFKEILVQ